MSKQIMTDVQLAELHDDIRDGVSMIVAVDHYYHLAQQRDDLLTACKGLVADLELIEQDESITACQCLAKAPDDIVEPPPCNYCRAKTAIANAK